MKALIGRVTSMVTPPPRTDVRGRSDGAREVAAAAARPGAVGRHGHHGRCPDANRAGRGAECPERVVERINCAGTGAIRFITTVTTPGQPESHRSPDRQLHHWRHGDARGGLHHRCRQPGLRGPHRDVHHSGGDGEVHQCFFPSYDPGGRGLRQWRDHHSGHHRRRRLQPGLRKHSNGDDR